MKKCPQCSNVLSDDEQKCDACGLSIEDEFASTIQQNYQEDEDYTPTQLQATEKNIHTTLSEDGRFVSETVLANRYRILGLLGKGGMGEVYLAVDEDLDRKVAIKFLSKEFVRDTDKLNRFIREAKSASALNHPNIITIYEIGESGGSRFIAAEHIEGETLGKKLENKSVRLKFILETAIQIASALDAAHSVGVVHRDIKPENVMIRPDGLVKILDFGIAKLSEKQTSEIEPEDKTAIQINTVPGMIIGTANYMSPEQAKGREVDARTDIFSFGVVLYEMIAGHLPFEGETAMESISSIIKDEPKPLNDNGIPPEIKRILDKTLRKNPDKRYQTTKDLLIDLKDVKQELEFQDKLEKTVQPNEDEQKTQMLRAATVDEKQQITTANDSISIKKSSFGKLAIGAAAILLVSIIGLGYLYFSSNNSNQIDSIAVMPFANESGNEDIEYLADGMTETLISSLSNIPNLSVKARSTVFYYKGKNVSPKEVGEQLGVEAVLLGRLVQRDNDLKLNLELVDAATQNVIWSENYDRKMSEIVSLQKEIAENVSSKLQLKLSGEQEKKADTLYTSNPEAYQAYLKGRFYWNKRTEEDIKKGIEYFNKAIEIDPGFAPAWSGLADSYVVLPAYSDTKYKDIVAKVESAAKKAIELDPTSAEAYTSLASLRSDTWKFEEAERLFKKSIELDPDNATTHQWYALYLISQRRFDEAIREGRRSVELAPFNKVMYVDFGYVLLSAKRYDEAIKQLSRGIELYPDFLPYYYTRGDAYRLKGMESEAFKDYVKGLELDNTKQELIQRYKKEYERSGLKAAGVLFAKERINDEKSSYVSKASQYAVLEEKEKAIENLYKAYEDREPALIDMDFVEEFKILRDDPRYKELNRKIGVPQ